MSAPVFIARLIGPLFVVIGIGMLLNHGFYTAMIAHAVRHPTLVYMAGFLSLSAGLAVLNVYRAWTADWRVIVTVLGYLMVIGGVVRIVLPQLIEPMARAIYSGPAAIIVVGVVVLVVGGYLGFEGYRAK